MNRYDDSDYRQGTSRTAPGAGGFSMVEMLVAMAILSVVTLAMLTFLFGTSRNWQSGQESAEALDNARIGLNRMTRELRQSSNVTGASADSVTFVVDFGDGEETITYSYVAGSGEEPGVIWRESSAAASDSILVETVNDATFEYFGSDYRCDINNDGLVTFAELQDCDASPEAMIARVDISLFLDAGDSVREFIGQAWLRNRVLS